jgi:hypothetical protein
MATLEIPVNGNLSSQVMTIALEGVRYRLKVYYSFRAAIWQLDVQTDRETDLLLGLKLVPDWPLIARFKINGLPPGEFRAVDTSEEGLPPGRDDFGSNRRVRLRYEEAA